MSGQDEARRHDDNVVTVAEAARIAERSTRTIRRAYMSGSLVAHRDGNGRIVRIRYGDLRAWLLAEVVSPKPEPPASDAVGRLASRVPAHRPRDSGNLELLAATRERLGRGVRATAVGPQSAGRRHPRPA
jgi:excisionase family DNA binding protein